LRNIKRRCSTKKSLKHIEDINNLKIQSSANLVQTNNQNLLEDNNNNLNNNPADTGGDDITNTGNQIPSSFNLHLENINSEKIFKNNSPSHKLKTSYGFTPRDLIKLERIDSYKSPKGKVISDFFKLKDRFQR
jgi:hypothetical protein